MLIYTDRFIRRACVGVVSTALAVEVWHGGGLPHIQYEIPAPTAAVIVGSPMTNTAAAVPLIVRW